MKIRLFVVPAMFAAAVFALSVSCPPVFASSIVSKDDLTKAFETDYKQALASSQWQAETEDFSSWYSYSSSKLVSTFFSDLFPLPPTLDPKSKSSPAQLQRQLAQSLWDYAGTSEDEKTKGSILTPNFKQGDLNDLETAIVGAKLAGGSPITIVAGVPNANATVGSVPEPATVMLLGCSMVVLGLLLASRSVPGSTQGPKPPDAGSWPIF